MTPSSERDHETTPPTPVAPEMLEELLRFGALMLRAGATTFRVRGLMTRIARGLGFDALSVQFGLGSITASGWRRSEVTTLVCPVGPHGVNDADYQPPFALTARLNKLTIKVDRPKLSPADIKKLEEAMRNNKMSE